MYAKLLNIIKAVEQAIPEWPVLDVREQEILDQLAMQWNTQGNVTVLEAMDMLPNVGASTMHKRISNLVDKGVIKLDPVSTDRRIKLVTPTDLTLRYFDELATGLTNGFATAHQK